MNSVNKVPIKELRTFFIGRRRIPATQPVVPVGDAEQGQQQAEFLLLAFGSVNLLCEKSVDQKLARVEEVMPMRPTTCSKRLISLLTGLNPTIGNDSFGLPPGEPFHQKSKNPLFARK